MPALARHSVLPVGDAAKQGNSMKFRTVLLLLLILMVAGLVALNLDEVLRPTALNLGVTSVEAPLGLVMLGLMAVLLLVALTLLVLNQTSHLMEMRRITKEATEQRHLADKAETSRFVELREFMQQELQALTARDQAAEARVNQRLDELQVRLAEVIEQTGNGLGAGLGELEDRLERQFKPASGA